MKILHTSDWHLGRTLEQNSLHEAHTLYINHLIEVIEEHKVDALLVAGDVYDYLRESWNLAFRILEDPTFRVD